MIVDLAEIEGGSRRFEFALKGADLEQDAANVRFTDDVRVTGEVHKQSVQIDVQGRITGPAEFDCTRCLNPVPQELAIDFDVSFVAPEHFATDKEREVSGDDLDTDVLESDRLDLKDVVREQVLLNLPVQVFCRPDCQGLCPMCGADRNVTDCKCDLEGTDPRWAALKDFRS